MTTPKRAMHTCGKVPAAPVAHSEEQRTFNPRVRRSKLRGGTTNPSPDLLPGNMRAKIQIELCLVPELPGFCWGWTGALNSRGYSCIAVAGKSQLAHRVSYELLVGSIPAGMQIDHLCLNKRCCNPAHLEPVTAVVNGRRARADQFYCAQGHPLAGRNLVIRKRRDGEFRVCRLCQYEWQRQHYQKLNPGARKRSFAAKRAEILADARRALADQLAVAS